MTSCASVGNWAGCHGQYNKDWLYLAKNGQSVSHIVIQKFQATWYGPLFDKCMPAVVWTQIALGLPKGTNSELDIPKYILTGL